jgi:hypothetical protein
MEIKFRSKIKFSHCYGKLLDGNERPVLAAKLLEVLPVDLGDLSRWFIAYDTDHGVYKLPKKGKYLLLIFRRTNSALLKGKDIFTTLRRATPEKEKFYRGAIGQWFDVIIERKGAKV